MILIFVQVDEKKTDTYELDDEEEEQEEEYIKNDMQNEEEYKEKYKERFFTWAEWSGKGMVMSSKGLRKIWELLEQRESNAIDGIKQDGLLRKLGKILEQTCYESGESMGLRRMVLQETQKRQNKKQSGRRIGKGNSEGDIRVEYQTGSKISLQHIHRDYTGNDGV
ncbi:hypothetical protein AX774_g2575 [Zancudomyces culisetae]|uniref:Uncharacterized protein n=1 Tax=Zancudomyces culisetae TaxID=1213189 RepID=A0A1R1PSI6_ZANCU|nr:hypothetical protein AX774_g2575 [Zancudomyces culisetae]|eukprot:OMH83911.1 hypothetical protein AX774_g2575 [Zancudomyces culisetae]